MNATIRNTILVLFATTAWLEACRAPTCGDYLDCDTGSPDSGRGGTSGSGGSAGKGGTAGQGGAFDGSAGTGGTSGASGSAGSTMRDGGGAAGTGGTGSTSDASDASATGGAGGASGSTMTDASAGKGGTGGMAGNAATGGSGATAGTAGTGGSGGAGTGGTAGTGGSGATAGTGGQGGSNDSGTTDTGSGGTGGGTADGSSGDADVTDTRDAGFQCFSYPYGPNFFVTYSTSSIPTFVGGSIVDGFYYLSAYVVYDQGDGGTDAGGVFVSGTLAFSGGDIFYAIQGFEALKRIGTYSTSGFTLSTQAMACVPDGGTSGGNSLDYDYSATSTTIVTHARGSQAVLTWTKQ